MFFHLKKSAGRRNLVRGWDCYVFRGSLLHHETFAIYLNAVTAPELAFAARFYLSVDPDRSSLDQVLRLSAAVDQTGSLQCVTERYVRFVFHASYGIFLAHVRESQAGLFGLFSTLIRLSERGYSRSSSSGALG